MLSKSKVVAFRQCPKRLWLSKHHPELAEYSRASQAAFAVGHSIGDIAQKLYGPGELIFDSSKPDLSGAIVRTRAFSDRTTGTLFEAAYRADETLILADVVRLTPSGAEIIEVKSSASVKEYHVDDAATQAYVMRRSGVPVRSVSIAHVDTTFVYPGGGQYDGLLREANITAEVDALASEVAKWINEAKAVLSGSEPTVLPGRQCTRPFECPFYDHCNVPDGREYPIENLPGVGARKARKMLEAGIREAREIPPEMRDTPNLERAYQAVVSGAAIVSRAETELLRNLPYPRFYLDFETISFAVPIWERTSPYQALPFQWSIHVEAGPGRLEHYGFLDLSGACPGRACMAALIDRLSDPGPVLVYTGYEKGVLTKMSRLYPELSARLMALVERLVDLHPIAKAGYYHRDMQGSWSIKAILPTIEGAPSYDALSGVHNGMEAQSAYLEAIHPETTAARRGEIHRSLTDYCRLDTRAMVVLAERLAG